CPDEKTKALFRKQMDFILKNVSTLKITVGADRLATMPEGAQSTPIRYGEPEIYLRPHLMVNVSPAGQGKDVPYVITPDHIFLGLVLPQFGHLSMDDDAIKILFGNKIAYDAGVKKNVLAAKGLPPAWIRSYDKKQIAALLANELLHIAQERHKDASYYH